MKLTITERSSKTRGEVNKIRREGGIVANIYNRGKDGENVYVDGAVFKAHLRAITPGHLPTTIFTLVDAKGKERRAIVKDIQYHVTTYNILHIDLEILNDKVEVNVKVPIECVGDADCAGVKLGGVLRRVIRHVKVRCLPKDIPSSFKIDVRSMMISQTKKLKEMAIPEGVRPLISLNNVAVIVAKK